MSYIGGQDESGPKFTIEYQEFTDRTARGRGIGGGAWGWGWGGGGCRWGGGSYETQIRFKRSLSFRRFRYKRCLVSIICMYVSVKVYVSMYQNQSYFNRQRR
jgi:hypothetical protein